MKKRFLLLICLIAYNVILAQDLETSFHSPLPIRPAFINKILTQPDGKYLLGGEINFYGTQRLKGLVRLNADESIDNTFSPSVSEDLFVADIELQSTGNIVVLIHSKDYSKSSVYQFDTNGLLKNKVDGLFLLSSLTVQSDDKVLVCGSKSLLRYNSDLTTDQSFNNTISFDAAVTDVQQYGNSLIVSGLFSTVNGVTKNDLVKLDMSGNIDNSFDTGTGTTDYIGAISIQTDGKILLGNTYINSFNGITENGIARLNVDGSVDNSFNSFSFNGPVSRIFLDGNDIYAAAFLYYNSSYGNYLFKLSNDGSLDNSFGPVEVELYSNSFYQAWAASPSGFVINNSQNSGNVFGVSKFDHSGTKVNGFAPEVARFGTFTSGSYFNNKLLVGGDFVRVDGFETYGVVSISMDGTVNQEFALTANLGEVIQLKTLGDENVLVSTGPSFVKLNSNGAIQPDFSWSHFKDLYNVEKFIVLDNGKIVAADANELYRLNADGSEDTSFDIGTGKSGWTSTGFDFDIQYKKVIYGSEFDHFNGTPVPQIVRLNENGSVDLTFDVGSGPGDSPFKSPLFVLPPNISVIKVLDTNEVLVGGQFLSFNGVAVPHGLVKLSADGVMDLAFNDNQKLGTGAQVAGVYLIDNIVRQIGSKVVIGQRQTGAIYVINLDGTEDPNFKIPSQVGFLNDLIPYAPPSAGSSISGRLASKPGTTKFTTKEAPNLGAFALGSFTIGTQADPALLIKLSTNLSPLTNQVITFNSLATKIFGDAAFDLTAVASSNLPITYASSNESVATIVNSKVIIVGVGSTVITAHQVGDATHNPANDVSQTLNVNKANQAITFLSLSDHKVGDAPFLLSATSSSALAIHFATASDKVSINGNQVSIVKAGNLTIQASQSGNEFYNSAQSVDQVLCINPAKPVITNVHNNSDALQLTSNVDVGNHWYLDGNLLQDALEKTYQPTINGSYSLKVSVDNCTSEFSDTFIFSITGIEEPALTSLILYPNPTSSALHVDLSAFSESEEIEISIYDSFGNRVEATRGQKTLEVGTNSYSEGIYFLVASQGGKVISGKFIKK
jgi:uncharacterized delta-60 repeat protein